MKKPQLFLLHFAGGNCYSFQFLLPFLQNFEVITLELPGRGRRMGEDLLHDFDAAANDIYRQLAPKITSSQFLLYGHSMGAYLALRVAHMLEKEGKYPACLIVSGNAGPGSGDGISRHLLDKEGFIAELKRLGGIPAEVLEETELFELFEPVLRSDFRISEMNGLGRDTTVKAPLFAMMGSLERQVDEISNWQHFTQGAFKYEILEGDHFFIHKHPVRIASIIKHCFHHSNLPQH
jgi:external thioesterase TEII